MGIWTIASVVCLIAAGLFLQRRNFDAAFVLAVLGAVAWFLNYRTQIRKTVNEQPGTTVNEDGGSEDDEDDEE